MTSRLLRNGRAATAAVLAVLAASAAACKTDRATVFEPVGPNSYDFHLTNAGSVAAAGLPQGTVKVTPGTTAAGSVVVTMTNLNRLTSGVYQVWAATSNADQLTNVTPLTGSVAVTPAGGATTTTNNTSSFADGGAGSKVVLTASYPLNSPLNVVFVSIETAAGATAPSTAIPLWATFTAGASSTKALTFGTFNADPAKRYAYYINGHGEGGVRGTTLIVDDTLLARPPIGYYYGAFLVNGDGTDTLYLGELTAPFPRRNISLKDADISIVDPVVETSPPALLYSSILFDGTKAGLKLPLPYEGLSNLFISLIAKQGPQGELPPNVVTSGTLPDIVTTPPAAPAP